MAPAPFPERWGFAFPSLRGLPLSFWFLMGYMFLELGLVDEYMVVNRVSGLGELVQMIRPRFVLGVLALLTSVGLLTSEEEGAARVLQYPQSRWLLAYTGVFVLAAFWGYNTRIGIGSVRDMLPMMISFFLLLANVRTSRRLTILLLVMSFGLGTFMSLSLYEWFNGRYWFRMGVVRMVGAAGSFTDPNAFAASIVYGTPIIIWLAVWTRSHFVRICATGYALLAIYCVIKTSSRSGFVLLLLTCIWGFFQLPKGKPRWITLVVVGLLGGVLLANLTENQTRRIQGIFKAETYDEDTADSAEGSARGRIEGFKLAVKVWEEHPLLGIGPGTWSLYRMERIDGRPSQPHNLPGQLLASVGILGTLTFVGFLIATFVYGFQGFRERRKAPDPRLRASAGLCSVALFTIFLLLVSGLGGHNMDRPNWFWMSALTVLALTVRYEPEEGAVDGPDAS